MTVITVLFELRDNQNPPTARIVVLADGASVAERDVEPAGWTNALAEISALSGYDLLAWVRPRLTETLNRLKQAIRDEEAAQARRLEAEREWADAAPLPVARSRTA